MEDNKTRGIWGWSIVWWIITGSLLLYTGFFLFLGLNETANRCAIAWSSKISFLLFCMAFSASGLHHVLKNSFSFWWLMNRKYFGIAFGLSHLLHLLFLLLLQTRFHPVFNLAAETSLLAGGIAYLFIVLMLLTSFDFFAKWLSRKQWKLLHTIGGHWIWFIFMSTYIKKVLNVGWEFSPFVFCLLLVMGLRLRKLLTQNQTV